MENKTLISRSKEHHLWDWAFYISYFYAFNLAFFKTTLYSELDIFDYYYELRWLMFIATGVILLVLIRDILFVYEDRKTQIISLILLLIALPGGWRDDTSSRTVFLFIAIILASRTRSLRTILKVALYSGTFWLFISFIGSKIGWIEDLVYGGGRHSFGIIYCTDLACHIFCVLVALWLLREGKLKIYDYAILIFANIANLLWIRGKVCAVCLLLLLLGMLWNQFVIPLFSGISGKKYYQVTRNAICVFLITLPVLLALMSILLSYFYTDDPGIFYNKYPIMHTLQLRYEMGCEAFDLYEVKNYGVGVWEQGYGSSTTPPDSYFVLDISYMKILFSFGRVPLLIFTGLLVYTGIRAFREKRSYLLILMAIVAIDAAVEHHLSDVSYDSLILASLAVFDTEKGGSLLPSKLSDTAKSKS